MKYRAKPIIVEAFKITGVGASGQKGIPCTLENGQSVYASPGMIARMTPQPGDYWVIQSDGYIYLNPKAVFETKYEVVKDAD